MATIFSRTAATDDFRAGHTRLESLACDILVTPHPEASRLWERIAEREKGNPSALVDGEACRRYAATGRERLAARLRSEEEKR